VNFDGTLLIIPAYNEGGAIGAVVREVKEAFGELAVVVIDDCSRDETAVAAELAGARVLKLPCHLGLGGAVQAGYKLAFGLGYRRVVRIDGDGQHNPADIPRVLGVLEEKSCEVVIGVRAKESGGLQTHAIRKIGIHFFRLLLRPILGRTVTDPTSGFLAVNERALEVFARSFPLEYPEIETLVVLQRRRFRFEEVPCRMRQRMAGRSSITALRSVYYVIHVLLGVFINILRFDGRHRAKSEEGRPHG
jgi:glycosyltransferase involved in cell wall biosynthesis